MGVAGGPDIIDNGLALELDAADKNSYPGSGTTWFDLSGNANTGTLVNGPTFSTLYGGAIVFDGTDDRVAVPNSTTLQFSNANFTVESMITIDSISSKQRIVSRGSSGWSQGWHIAARPTQWEFECSDGISAPGNSFLINTPTTVGTNYVAWTVTASTAILYINGVQFGSPQTITEGTAFATSATTMGIGAFEFGGENLNGKIYFARLYSRTFSATEIAQNYNAMKTRFGL